MSSNHLIVAQEFNSSRNNRSSIWPSNVVLDMMGGDKNV